MKQYILLYVFMLMYAFSSAQIVNIEGKRINSDTTGFDGYVEGSFSMNKNTSLLMTVITRAQVQYKFKKDLILLLGDWRFTIADDKRFVNDGMAHLRYNHKFLPWLRWEVFNQIQYNELLSLRMRYLAGTGPRFKLTGKTEQYKAYLGTMYMFEYEHVQSDDTIYLDHRLSAYFSFTIDPKLPFSITGTTYYQPLLKDWRDFRVAGMYNFKMRVWKRLDVKIDFSFLYDARPPATVPSFVFGLATGLVFRFRP